MEVQYMQDSLGYEVASLWSYFGVFIMQSNILSESKCNNIVIAYNDIVLFKIKKRAFLLQKLLILR